MLPLLIALVTATTSFALPLRNSIPTTTRFENPKATNLIIHRDFLHRLEHDPQTNLVSFIERDTRGFFKKKEKDPGSKDDLSSEAGQTFSQKEIEKISTEVENSRAKVDKAMNAHAILEKKLEKAMQAGGKLTPVQTHHWVSSGGSSRRCIVVLLSNLTLDSQIFIILARQSVFLYPQTRPMADPALLEWLCMRDWSCRGAIRALPPQSFTNSWNLQCQS